MSDETEKGSPCGYLHNHSTWNSYFYAEEQSTNSSSI
jgi:hypothetical protein